MNEIPKRPLCSEPRSVEQFERELADHERAVAVRAVEALTSFVEANNKGPATEWIQRMNECHRLATKALAKIEASGWKP